MEVFILEWIIFFVYSWIIFFLLVDFKQLKTTIWGGILAVLIEIAIDVYGITVGWYSLLNTVLVFFNIPILFTFGPVLTMGILFSQYTPRKVWVKLFSLFSISTLFTIQELLLVNQEVIMYHRWSIYYSIIFNLSVFIVLQWFSMVILRKEGTLPK